MEKAQKDNLKQRLSNSMKNADNKAWYKKEADLLDSNHYDISAGIDGIETSKRLKVNYDLFNNIIDSKDFEYVCKPYGAKVGELPAKMTNRDITSGKIKAILGMEMKRPFSWNVVAVNPEATTRREEEEFNQFKDHVVSQLMRPIREKLEIEKAQANGEFLTPEDQERIAQEIEAELPSRTPVQIKKYMKREYQDPAEVMTNHLLNYLSQKCDIRRKFNNAFKHGMLSAKEVMFVGILNGEPEVWDLNSMRFRSDKNPDSQFIEDGEWATYEHRMTPSTIVKYFGDELTEEDLDNIYRSYSGKYASHADDLFTMKDAQDRGLENDSDDIKVLHCVWKALRKIGFLTYLDPETGEEEETIVDETYTLNREQGDIKIEWEWIPEVYETWKIKAAEPIYVKMQPVAGQFKDIDNVYHCKLPYYGVIYDNMNSEATSLMDRLKVYQYYYNIVMYRLELLIASDKGKKVLMNIGSIPTSHGFDLEKWQYFFESTPFMYFDPQEEGGTYQDANTIAKVVDLSLVSDIQKYIEIAEYLRRQAGLSVGITDQVEGQIGPNDAVTNTRQSLIQSSHVLEMYFELHNYTKRNVLQALIETAKIAYSENKPRKMTYILDDMSVALFDLDIGLLDASTLGLFVSNSAKAEEAKETIRQLTHAAMQNQKVELSDVLAVIRQEGIVEAEETLKIAEDTRREQMQSSEQQALQAQAEEAEKAREFIREQHTMEMERDTNRELLRRETLIATSAIQGMSFNPDADTDGDGVNDFLEIAKHGLNADIKKSEIALRKEELSHKKKMDEHKIKIDEQKQENESKKISIMRSKANSKT